MPFRAAPVDETRLASRPPYILPLWKMWPSPSHCVPHWRNMVTWSSAKPQPYGSFSKPASVCRPVAWSVPVATMLWMGFTRPKAPVWGPLVSKLSAHEMTLPCFTRRAARVMTSGVMKLRVPISSSGPQRPQFRNLAQYSSSSAGVTAARVVIGPSLGPRRHGSVPPSTSCDARARRPAARRDRGSRSHDLSDGTLVGVAPLDGFEERLDLPDRVLIQRRAPRRHALGGPTLGDGDVKHLVLVRAVAGAEPPEVGARLRIRRVRRMAVRAVRVEKRPPRRHRRGVAPKRVALAGRCEIDRRVEWEVILGSQLRDGGLQLGQNAIQVVAQGSIGRSHSDGRTPPQIEPGHRDDPEVPEDAALRRSVSRLGAPQECGVDLPFGERVECRLGRSERREPDAVTDRQERLRRGREENADRHPVEIVEAAKDERRRRDDRIADFEEGTGEGDGRPRAPVGRVGEPDEHVAAAGHECGPQGAPAAVGPEEKGLDPLPLPSGEDPGQPEDHPLLPGACAGEGSVVGIGAHAQGRGLPVARDEADDGEAERGGDEPQRWEEHTSELQSLAYLVCRLLLEKKK